MKSKAVNFIFTLWFALGVAFSLASCSGADKLALTGIQLLEQKKSLSALRYFNLALEKDADNALALYGKGQIMLSYEKTEDMGLRMLKKSIEGITQQDYRDKAILTLANHYVIKKNVAQVEAHLKLLQKQPINKFDTAFLEARYLLMQNRRNEALEKINSLINENTPSSHLEALQQFTGADLKDLKRATEITELLLKQKPKNKQYVWQAFSLYAERNEWVRALELFESLREVAPDQYDEKQWAQNIELIKNKKWKADISFLQKNEVR